MQALCDLCIVIPSDHKQIIEDFQLSVAHASADVLVATLEADAGCFAVP